MKFNSLAKIFMITSFILASFSCKKDEKNETLPYLNDSKFSMTVPKYVLQGDKLDCTPSGVVHPDNGNLGYVALLTRNSKTIKRDTLKTLTDAHTKEFSFVFPTDSVGTYTLAITAFADGYNPSTFNASIVLVGGLTNYTEENVNGAVVRYIETNPHATITGHGIDMDAGKYFDTEYNRYFYTEATEGLYWMQNNLMEDGGKPYFGEKAMQVIFGGYYTYDEAVSACPDGWRLPTAAEWDALIGQTRTRIDASAEFKDRTTVPGAWCSDVRFNDVEMWDYWPANQDGLGELCNLAGLSMIPCGYANTLSMKFDGLMSYAMFWSADENSKDKTQAKVYGIYNYDGNVIAGYHDKKSFGASVRCVKEK